MPPLNILSVYATASTALRNIPVSSPVHVLMYIQEISGLPLVRLLGRPKFYGNGFMPCQLKMLTFTHGSAVQSMIADIFVRDRQMDA